MLACKRSFVGLEPFKCGHNVQVTATLSCKVIDSDIVICLNECQERILVRRSASTASCVQRDASYICNKGTSSCIEYDVRQVVSASIEKGDHCMQLGAILPLVLAHGPVTSKPSFDVLSQLVLFLPVLILSYQRHCQHCLANTASQLGRDYHYTDQSRLGYK